METNKIVPQDSKKLNFLERKTIYLICKKLGIDFKNVLIPAKIIDKFGINEAINIGIRKIVEFFKPDILILDGLRPKNLNLFAKNNKNQPLKIKAFIKGDQKISSIALASIIAKHKRDEFMIKMSKIFTQYDFHIHKGYGTKNHYKKIKIYGLSPLHRFSFCKNLLTLNQNRESFQNY